MPLQAKGFGLWYVHLSGPSRRHGGCKELFGEMGSGGTERREICQKQAQLSGQKPF